MVKKHQLNRNNFFIVLLATFFLLSGCATALRNKELEKVAKDWSLVIRASQVIPVYPLTEDLQPGDVLLVQTPIEEQVKLYKDKGFLPLDQIEVRLQPRNYYEFYNGRYGITNKDNIPPAQWQAIDQTSHENKWSEAPHAAFPTYQFSVKTGSGLNLAIPIQGVPFALGLMNSGSANGSVTISSAYTYGLDNIHLAEAVRAWALQKRSVLRAYEPTEDGKYYYLRVVSRVYVTGGVNVTLNNDDATSGQIAAGADRTVNLMEIKDGESAKNYASAIGSINDLLKSQMPGVNAKIATASHRSVTLNQIFDKPLVIGYLGFDMPILRGGRLGAPISTLAQLTQATTLKTRQTEEGYVYRLAALAHVNNALKQLENSGNSKAKEVRDKLNKLAGMLPDKYPFTVYHQPTPGTIAVFSGIKAGSPLDKKNGFDGVLKYLGYADSSADSIRYYIQSASKNTDIEKKTIQEYQQELQQIRSSSSDIEDKLNGNAVLMETIDFIFLGNE